MSLTTDPTDERLRKTLPGGQHESYLVLSEEERAKGFVRPVRASYRHVGERPKHPTRPLTPAEQERYAGCSYVAYEQYPESESPLCGKFWTAEQLKSGCGGVTSMGPALAETYARQPSFYGATFCCNCGKHLPVAEFEWVDGGGKVGS